MVRGDKVLKICKKCGARCCKGGGSDFTKKEKDRVLKAGFKDYFIRISENHYELKTRRGRCPYLAKDLCCSIHRIRPLMCRCWPVYLKIKGKKREYFIIQCPLTPFLSRKELALMKKQASKLPKDLVKCFRTSLPKKKLR